MDTPVKVVQWRSKTDFTEHTFSLYKDDTILTTLTKIMGFLNITTEKLVPYVWSNDQPLRFKMAKSFWPNYNPHPFLAPLQEKPPTPNVTALSDRMLDYDELHFVTYTDLAAIATKNTLRYYFPNEKDKFDPASITSALYQHSLLQELQALPPAVHKTMTTHSTSSYLRAFYNAPLPSGNYRQWFEQLPATTLIPFIQLYEDINHIYYKVYKGHTIPPAYFTDWTLLEKMKNQHSLICYAFIKGHSYGKFFFDHDTQTLQVSYFLDVTDTIHYTKINTHLHSVLEELEKRWHFNITPIVDRFALKTDLQIKDTTLNDIFMVSSKLLPVFKLPEKNRLQKNILDLQYIRVAKYGQSINLVEFMKSKIHFGIALIDIIEELKAYGLEELTVREYYEQILQEQELPPAKIKRSFKNLGLLMHISPIAAGFNIYIDNAVSEEEIQRALYWTRATLYKASLLHKESQPQKVPSPPSLEEEEEKPVVIPSQEERFRSSSSSELSLGGAIGKKYQRYFKNMLEKLDPDLFAKSDNYARKCQISDLRQPVGITMEQKEAIDRAGYADGYDNSLIYGSDPNRPAVYMCPKIWCPAQQIPLSYEKYQALGEKCPDPTDEPILLYTTSSWYNDPLRKHYVGFLKERGYNNLKLPCCFKTPKEQEKPPSKSIEDSYIIDKMKVIEPGRFGTIPSSLHEFLYPNVPYTLCKNTVKAEQCLLRKGIASGQLMEAVGYLLDMSLEEMIRQLDPLTFLTLENGQVYTYFLPQNIPKVTNELRVWLTKFPAYTKMFQLEELLPHINNPKEAPIYIQYRLARQALIRESYYNYIAYLKSPEANNPAYLFDLVQHLGAILVVWNRDSQSIATLKCPFAPKNKWELALPYIIVMQQDMAYEPLVLVDRDKHITQKIAFTTFKQLTALQQQCPPNLLQEDRQLHEIKTLYLWIQTVIKDAGFKLKAGVLDPLDRMVGVFCANHVYIRFAVPLSMFSLKNLLSFTTIDTLLYQEEIQGKSYDIEVATESLQLLELKIKKLSFGLDLGTLLEDTGDHFTSLYTVPAVKYPLPPKLPLQLKDTFIRRSDLIDADNARWYKAKKTILTKLLNEYEALVMPLLQKPLLEQLTHLREVFAYMQEPAKVAVLLEELPYADKSLLQQTLDRLLLDKPYYHKDDRIYEQKRSWIFTQKAVEKGRVENVMRPTTVIRPPVPIESQLTIRLTTPSQPLPAFINPANIESRPIPTKWRSKFWSSYQLGMVKEYSNQTFLDFLTWIARQQGIEFDWFDIDFYLRRQVYDMLEDGKYEELVEDMSMRKMWMEGLQKTYRSPNELLTALKTKTPAELRLLYKTPTQMIDLYLYYVSALLSVSFLVLHKGRDVASARGNIDELLNASKFISRVEKWENHPVCLLYKMVDGSYCILMSGDGRVGYYENGLSLPEAVHALIHKHL